MDNFINQVVYTIATLGMVYFTLLSIVSLLSGEFLIALAFGGFAYFLRYLASKSL